MKNVKLGRSSVVLDELYVRVVLSCVADHVQILLLGKHLQLSQREFFFQTVIAVADSADVT